MRLFMTGQKRPVISEEGEGPSKKNRKCESNSSESPAFECTAGTGRKQKIKDYIERCKRRECEPAKIPWDKDAFVKNNGTENDPNNHRQIVGECNCRISEVLGPNKKLSGKNCALNFQLFFDSDNVVN